MKSQNFIGAQDKDLFRFGISDLRKREATNRLFEIKSLKSYFSYQQIKEDSDPLFLEYAA